jgi:hypothetical protein
MYSRGLTGFVAGARSGATRDTRRLLAGCLPLGEHVAEDEEGDQLVDERPVFARGLSGEALLEVGDQFDSESRDFGVDLLWRRPRLRSHTGNLAAARAG